MFFPANVNGLPMRRSLYTVKQIFIAINLPSIVANPSSKTQKCLTTREDWPKIKPTTPFGQVPMLEIDGKRIAQSVAICRFLAKKCNLVGKDDLEALEIDATVDTIHDVRAKLAAYHYEENAETKAAKLKVANEVVPFVLERLDTQVKNNGGYFVAGALSWADLTFVALLDYLNFMYKSDLIEKYDNLKALKQKVLDIPAIKDWVAKRPESEC
ncbi:hypothetical protein KPH14_002468 [Odynerus spinipes]|uniref:glutathione transferase n=1 Tax=Odynerus spinipes TaxID=1348599 RepID=A0AAD9RTC1_9HYME|nr:hypothetical protein KPH14_002468 [Odynerus spinipes]